MWLLFGTGELTNDLSGVAGTAWSECCSSSTALKVETATFESRGPVDDRRDRSMLDALCARNVVSGELRMAHTPGPKDALLWVPDIVCGAVTNERIGQEEYSTILAARLRIISIAVD
jgi:hypothetical protein